MFIEINSDQLSKPITIGNVCKPSYDNNNNHSIENFNLIGQLKNEILKVDLAEQNDHNLMTDPNRTYAVLEGVIKKAKDECFPEKKRYDFIKIGIN